MKKVKPSESTKFAFFLNVLYNEDDKDPHYLISQQKGRTVSIILILSPQTGGSLQQRAEGWREQVNQTRGTTSHSATAARIEEKLVGKI